MIYRQMLHLDKHPFTPTKSEDNIGALEASLESTGTIIFCKKVQKAVRWKREGGEKAFQKVEILLRR